MSKKVLTFGVWDLLHIGHVRFLEEAHHYGNLIVGVPTDDVVMEDKGSYPVIPFDQRVEMIEALWVVNGTIPYRTLSFIAPLEISKPNVLAVGEQWGSEERHLRAEDWCKEHHCKVVRIARTEGVSTTDIINKIKGM